MKRWKEQADLVLGHHVGGVDERRPDGGFVLQRLPQEGVVRLTCKTGPEKEIFLVF